MRAYTGEGANIADHASLLRFGLDAGLGERDVRTLPCGDGYSAAVRSDHREGRALGVSGVPTVVVNRRIVLSGAQPSHAYLEALAAA